MLLDGLSTFALTAALFLLCAGRCEANLRSGNHPRAATWALVALAVAIVLF
jgi:hypothetical protein